MPALDRKMGASAPLDDEGFLVTVAKMPRSLNLGECEYGRHQREATQDYVVVPDGRDEVTVRCLARSPDLELLADWLTG
jgi:hypothetical protein